MPLMPDTSPRAAPTAKFQDPLLTVDGQPRAVVAPGRMETLWFNTGSLCNIACDGCYTESTPTNDRLAYLSADDVKSYLDEAESRGWPLTTVGFTGGEPFTNRQLPAMLADTLRRGLPVLVLTNGMKPLHHHKEALRRMRGVHGDRLALRVSVDHYTPEGHEKVRGAGTWSPMLEGLCWLAQEGFTLSVASRTPVDETIDALRTGFADLFRRQEIPVDAFDPAALVVFPEMDTAADAAEITPGCFSLLGVDPASLMCSGSRMILKRRGESRATVVPCTLLPYDPAFELGPTLADAERSVVLNHPFCAQFCVLGGASCRPR